MAFAKENAEREGATVKVYDMDVLEGTAKLASQHYDIVIADPAGLYQS